MKKVEVQDLTKVQIKMYFLLTEFAIPIERKNSKIYQIKTIKILLQVLVLKDKKEIKIVKKNKRIIINN